MSKPPSDKPPKKPAAKKVQPSVQKPAGVKPELFPFGLSAKQFTKVSRKMLTMAQSVCRHSDASPGDAVQQAFVTALSKPSTERPSTQDQEKFFGWMCELAKWEAMTLRTDDRRQAQREIVSESDVTQVVAVLPSVGTVEARKIIEPAFIALTPADQALLHALFAEGKTISEVAGEIGLRRTTLDSRVQRILDLLYAAIQATIAALVLLVPKKARATQQGPRLVVQATQFGGAMTMTVFCGALVPTGSSVTTEPSTLASLTPYSTPQTSMTQVASLEPSVLPEVEPEEPKGLDAETNECSAGDMKSTKFASSLQETALSLALLVAPAATQVACAGTQQQTPPPQQQVVERDDSPDPYDVACDFQRLRGSTCETREEWDKHFVH